MPAITGGLRPRIAALLSSIAETWKLTPDGQLSTSSIHIGAIEGALVQLLNPSGFGLSNAEFERVAFDSIRSILKRGENSVEELEAEIRSSALVARRVRKHRYYALSRCHFSVPAGTWIPFKLWDSYLVITDRPPGFFGLEEFFVSGYGRINPAEPFGGAFLLTTEMARTPLAASDGAFKNISLALGALNFWLNLKRYSLHFGKQRPAGTMMPGTELVFYDKEFSQIKGIYAYYTTPFKEVRRLDGSDLDRISSINMLFSALGERGRRGRYYYEHAFQLYFDAMAETDVEVATIRLWKLAEFVTFAQGQDASVISRRLGITWDDKEVVSAVCSAVGHLRNQIVHNETSPLKVDEVLGLFRQFVEVFIWNSLSPDVNSVSHWESVVRLASSNFDLSELRRALPLAMKLKD